MDNGTPDTPKAALVGAAFAPGLSLSALQRRRLLLRGVGKGAAVVAAAVPIQSFAVSDLTTTKSPDGKARMCSVSGVGSLLPSSAPRNLPSCSGKRASYWRNQRTWPTITIGVTLVARSTLFKDIFTTSTLDKTLEECLSGTPEEKTWVRALLNAGQFSPVSFPYTPLEVVGLYNNAMTQGSAFAFFRDFV